MGQKKEDLEDGLIGIALRVSLSTALFKAKLASVPPVSQESAHCCESHFYNQAHTD